jgi:hypothetical protein
VYEFDAEYLQDASRAAVHYLRRSRTCEIAYQPGNGTLYELVLVPAGAGLAKASDWMDHRKARSITQDRPELAEGRAEDEWIMLAWLGHGCWPIDLGAVWTANYLAEKFADCTLGDGEALRALLLAIADAAGLRRLQVAS